MKIEKYTYPKSSFLSIEKDTQAIVDKMLANERLKRLLYYDCEDALLKPDLDEEQTFSLLQNHEENGVDIPARIRFIPKIYVDAPAVTYIIISFDNFFPAVNNPEFRDCTIHFDIICHFDLWKLNDMQLRPYKIAAELDSMFDGARMSGIGKLEFAGASNVNISGKEFAGVSLMYTAVHGTDDEQWFDHEDSPVEDDDIFINFPNLLGSLE